MKFVFKKIYNKPLLNYFIITLSFIIFLSAYLNPSNKDFKSFLADLIKTEIIKSGESIGTANIIYSLSNVLLSSDKSIIERNNYYIYSSYNIDLSVVRSFGYDIKDVKAIGVFGKFIIFE